MWKRAPNFFDVVAYTGDGATSQVVNHNLGTVPEMMWIKSRSNSRNWVVYHKDLGNAKQLRLNTTVAELASGNWSYTTPTDSVFTIGNGADVNSNNYTQIAYLFASLDGVSKVFSVTKSSGSDASVNCGFSAGPRFVLLKRTDSTGDWYVWDSERGIVAGNDPLQVMIHTYC
jgi:hypothetical protein